MSIILYVSINDALNLISQVQWIYMFPITVIYFLSWVLRGKRWKMLLNSSNIVISLNEAICLSFIGNTINLVIPAKMGDFSKYNRLAGRVLFHESMVAEFCL